MEFDVLKPIRTEIRRLSLGLKQPYEHIMRHLDEVLKSELHTLGCKNPECTGCCICTDTKCKYNGETFKAGTHLHYSPQKGFWLYDETEESDGIEFYISGRNGLRRHNMEENTEGSEGSNSYRVPIAWRFDLIPPLVLRRLAAIYEKGAKKYGDAKYISSPLPFSVIDNHLMNHYLAYKSGDRSEDHLAKAIWGLAAMMTLEELAKEGFIESTYDLTEFGSHVSEAVTERKR